MLIQSFSKYRNISQERLVKVELLDSGTIKTTIDCLSGKRRRVLSYWNQSLYDLPMATLETCKLQGDLLDELRDYAKRFTLSYFEAVGEVQSPKQFKEYDSSSYVYKEKEDKESFPSGVPLWMLESCKVWVECFHRTGSQAGTTAYYRRARFNEEKRDIVDRFLPNCQSCPFRVNCTKPCSNPEIASQTNKKNGGL